MYIDSLLIRAAREYNRCTCTCTLWVHIPPEAAHSSEEVTALGVLCCLALLFVHVHVHVVDLYFTCTCVCACTAFYLRSVGIQYTFLWSYGDII